ncbi:hypothetical protein BGW80DRAFT_1314682, partial [Lactifluus volemus]
MFWSTILTSNHVIRFLGSLLFFSFSFPFLFFTSFLDDILRRPDSALIRSVPQVRVAGVNILFQGLMLISNYLYQLR